MTVGIALQPPYGRATALYCSPAVHSTFQIWIWVRFSICLAGKCVCKVHGHLACGFLTPLQPPNFFLIPRIRLIQRCRVGYSDMLV
jgi:hypothetical protein